MALEVSAREANLKQQFKLLLDSTAEAIYGIDLAGKCMFCNPACARLLGYAKGEDLLGQNMHSLVHHTRPDGSPFPAADSSIPQATRAGLGTRVEDAALYRAHPTSSPTHYSSNPLFHEPLSP